MRNYIRDHLEILAELRKLASQAPPREEWDIQTWSGLAGEVRERKLKAERKGHRLTHREIAEAFANKYSEHVIGRWVTVAKRWPTPPQDAVLQEVYRCFFWKNETGVGLSRSDLDLPDDELRKKYLECRERRRKRQSGP
jgi:hypothetical protein